LGAAVCLSNNWGSYGKASDDAIPMMGYQYPLTSWGYFSHKNKPLLLIKAQAVF
jgi:hypothetical protein